MILRACLTIWLMTVALGDEIRRKSGLINTFRMKCDALPYRTHFSMELGTCYVRYNDECTKLNMMFDPSETPIERSVQNYLNKLGFPSMQNTVGFRTCKFAADISCTTSSGQSGTIKHGYCLQSSQQEATYNEARAACASKGGRLFVPHNHEDIRRAIEFTLYGTSKAYWIGRTTEDGRIKNIDRTDIDFYRWTARKDFSKSPFASALLAKYDLGSDGFNHGFEVPSPFSSRYAYLCELSAKGDYIYETYEDGFILTEEPTTTQQIRTTTRRYTIHPIEPEPEPTDWTDAIKLIRMNGLPLLMANSWKENRPLHYRYTVDPAKFTEMTHTSPYTASCGIVASTSDDKIRRLCPKLEKRVIWTDYIYLPRTPRNTIAEENNAPKGGKIQDEFYLAPYKGYCGANFELLEYVMNDPSEKRFWVYYPPNEEAKSSKGYPEIQNMKFTRSVGWVWKYPFDYEDLDSVVKDVTKTGEIVYRFITSLDNNYKHAYTSDKETAEDLSSTLYMEPPLGLVMPTDLYERSPSFKRNCPYLLKSYLFRETITRTNPNNWYGYTPLNNTGKYEIIGSHYCAPFRSYCGAYLEVFNIVTKPDAALEDVLITTDEAEVENVRRYNPRYGHERNPFGRCFIWTPDRRVMEEWSSKVLPLTKLSQPVIHANKYSNGKNEGFHIYTIDPYKQQELKRDRNIDVGEILGKVVDQNLPNGREILRLCPRLVKIYLFQEKGGKGRTYIGSGKPRVKGNFEKDGTYYCAPYEGYCGATLLLWQISSHQDNKDITYTTDREEAIEGGHYPSYSYRICYIWNQKHEPKVVAPTKTEPEPEPELTPEPEPETEPVGPKNWDSAIRRIRINGNPLLMATAFNKRKPRHYRYTSVANKYRQMTHITPNSESCGIVGKPNDKKLLKLCPKLKKMIIWRHYINGVPINTIAGPDEKPAGAVAQDEFYMSASEGYCGTNFELEEYKKDFPKERRYWVYYPPTEEMKTKAGYKEIAQMTKSRSVGWIWKYSFIYENLDAVTAAITKTGKVTHRFLTSHDITYRHVYTTDLNTAQSFNEKYFLESPPGLLMPAELYEKDPIMKKNCPHLLKANLFRQSTGGDIRNYWYGYNPLNGTGQYEVLDTHYCAPFRGYCGAYLEVYNVRTSQNSNIKDCLVTGDENEVNHVLNTNNRYQYEFAPFGRCFVWTNDEKVERYWEENILPVVKNTQPVIQSNQYNFLPNINYHIYTVDQEKQKELVRKGKTRVELQFGHLLNIETEEGRKIYRECPKLFKIYRYQQTDGRQRTHLGSRPPMVTGKFVKEETRYCAPYGGYCGAKFPLWQISSRTPGRDILYTLKDWKANKLGSAPTMYRYRICYVWN